MTKKKCPVCQKALSIVDASIVCRCKKVFCPKHRHFSLHDCIAMEPAKEVPETIEFKKVDII